MTKCLVLYKLCWIGRGGLFGLVKCYLVLPAADLRVARRPPPRAPTPRASRPWRGPRTACRRTLRPSGRSLGSGAGDRSRWLRLRRRGGEEVRREGGGGREWEGRTAGMDVRSYMRRPTQEIRRRKQNGFTWMRCCRRLLLLLLSTFRTLAVKVLCLRGQLPLEVKALVVPDRHQVVPSVLRRDPAP